VYRIILVIICSCLWKLSFSQARYRLAAESGGHQIIIDTVSTTRDLIKKLETPWEFQFTGKVYYIGYTDLMFAIAHKGDRVVDTLVDYYKTTQSPAAWSGIIYTLHLIGIKGKIAGRHFETFKSQKACKALLSLLHDGVYNTTIIKLLMRDPWLSDVPELINYLSIEKNIEFTWPVVKALIRYHPPHFCIGQSINELAQNYTITNPEYASYHLDDAIFNTATKNSLRLFEDTYPHFIHVEPILFEQVLVGNDRSGSNETVSLIEFMRDHNTGIVDLFSVQSSYTALGSRFVHYLEDDQLYFCSMETAQKRIVDWWSQLDRKEQAFFKNKNYYNRP